MCGISGFVKTGVSAGSRFDLQRMMEAIHHRGPDGEGIHEDGTAFLGHRRLSIIDVAGGHQPMSNEDGTIWITFNGEIFNHASIRPELEAAGHRYVTRCDTETIVHAYEQFGDACVEKFRGMFSFAIWDETRKKLLCARDRLGIKPFYYYADKRVFVFGSEIKALLEHPEVSADFDSSLLPEYLTFGYTSGERTLFRGIRKLMPGHTLTLDTRNGEIAVQRYWDVPPATQDTSRRSEDEWVSECRRRLEETVRMRLMSDVPLGMFLSGGVDSSAIAALMKRMRSEPVKTFAVGYNEAQFSELAYARQVSEAIGTDHHEVVINSNDFFGVLPKLVWHEDEPIAWPSSVSLYFVSKLAAEHVKVVLTGEGSDELFAGYHRYQHYLKNQQWAAMYNHVPHLLRTQLRSFIQNGEMIPADLRRKLEHTFLARENNIESLHLDNFYGAFSGEELEGLLLAGGPGPSSCYAEFLNYWDSRGGSTLSRMLYADQKTYLVELLMKQDQMSMACSIESRVPFLDHPLVEFAATVPDDLKIKNGTGKYIMKRAVEDILPHEIVHRKKMGFPTPLKQWFREAQAAPMFNRLLDRNGFLSNYVNLHRVEQLIDKQRRGTEDATDRLWRLLNLQTWGDVFFSAGKSEPAMDYTGAAQIEA